MSDAETVPLPDGEYPAFVVDVDEDGGRVRALDLTILSGPHKGDVVRITARGMEGGFVELVGMPATITVTGGVPALSIDDA